MRTYLRRGSRDINQAARHFDMRRAEWLERVWWLKEGAGGSESPRPFYKTARPVP